MASQIIDLRELLPVGGESQSVDVIRMVKRVQMLAIVEVPKHGLGVLSAGRAQRTIRRHGHGVQVTVVANVIGLKLAVGQVPDLEDKTNIGEPFFALKT